MKFRFGSFQKCHRAARRWKVEPWISRNRYADAGRVKFYWIPPILVCHLLNKSKTLQYFFITEIYTTRLWCLHPGVFFCGQTVTLSCSSDNSSIAVQIQGKQASISHCQQTGSWEPAYSKRGWDLVFILIFSLYRTVYRFKKKLLLKLFAPCIIAICKTFVAI